MKSKIKLFGITVIVMVIGLFFVSCPFLEDGPSVSISGTPVVGEIFTVTSSGRGFSRDHGYEWFRASSPVGWGFRIGVGPEFTIGPFDVGNYIFARRFNTSTGERGEFIESNRIGPILPAD